MNFYISITYKFNKRKQFALRILDINVTDNMLFQFHALKYLKNINFIRK
jgi:hypothetical protein